MIYIYAELMLNVTHAAIYVSLKTPHNDKTLVEVTASHTSLYVVHDGETAIAELPLHFVDNGSLPLPTVQSTQLSFRLPIRLQLHNNLSVRSHLSREIPWSATSLHHLTNIACRYCLAKVVKPNIHTWKDLPHENWSETMDLWYCHPPDQSMPTGGLDRYLSTSDFEAHPGIGLVDDYHIVVSEEDSLIMQVCILCIGL